MPSFQRLDMRVLKVLYEYQKTQDRMWASLWEDELLEKSKCPPLNFNPTLTRLRQKKYIKVHQPQNANKRLVALETQGIDYYESKRYRRIIKFGSWLLGIFITGLILTAAKDSYMSIFQTKNTPNKPPASPSQPIQSPTHKDTD